MGGAGQPRSRTAGHWQNGLYQPFVPMSGSLRLHIQAFPPTRASPVPGTRGALGSAPQQQFSLLGCTNIPVRRMETDPLGQSPHCEGSWERGNEAGCYHLQVDLGTGVTLNTGVCKNAALHKLEKKNYFLKSLFSCLRVTATILNSSCCARHTCLQEFKV